MHLELQPYLHLDRGGGDWHAPSYGATWSPDPIMFRQTQYHDNRGGLLGKLTASFDAASLPNKLEVGGWYESNDTQIRRPRWRLANYQTGPDVDYSNVLRLDFDRTGSIGTTVFYAQNTTRLLEDKLAVTYGAKYLYVTADFHSNGNTATDGIVAPVFGDPGRPDALGADQGRRPSAGECRLSSERAGRAVHESLAERESVPVQPGRRRVQRVAVDVRLLPQHREAGEGHDGRARGTHAAWLDGGRRHRLHDRVSQSPARHRALPADGDVRDGLRQRRLGEQRRRRGRHRAGPRQRLQGDGDGLVQLVDVRQRLPHESERSDVRQCATKGKDVPDAPRLIGNASLAYTNGRLSANAGERFVGERFFTYTNDIVDDSGKLLPGAGKVPSYMVTDVSARYRLGAFSAMRSVDLQLNVTNLFDKRYISTMGSNGYTASSDFQTLLTGAPRQVFLTVSTTF